MHYLTNLAGIVLRNLAVPGALVAAARGRAARRSPAIARAPLCAGELEPALRALTKLAPGLAKAVRRAEHRRPSSSSTARPNKASVASARVFSSHPWPAPSGCCAASIRPRVSYFGVTAGLGAGGLDMAQVDQRVHDYIKVIG